MSTDEELLAWLRDRSPSAQVVLMPRRVDAPAITTAGRLIEALARPEPPYPPGIEEGVAAALVDLAHTYGTPDGDTLRTAADIIRHRTPSFDITATEEWSVLEEVMLGPCGADEDFDNAAVTMYAAAVVARKRRGAR